MTDLFSAVDARIPVVPVPRHAILVTGANSSGKTTLVRAAVHAWAGDPRVVAVYADSTKAYQTDPATVEANFRTLWHTPTPVLVIEGTDRPVRALARAIGGSTFRTLDVHVTEVAPGAMHSHLAGRCARAGKAFNASYWTEEKCRYEGMRRYRNLATRVFPGAMFWQIGDRYDGCDALRAAIRARIAAVLCSE